MATILVTILIIFLMAMLWRWYCLYEYIIRKILLFWNKTKAFYVEIQYVTVFVVVKWRSIMLHCADEFHVWHEVNQMERFFRVFFWLDETLVCDARFRRVALLPRLMSIDASSDTLFAFSPRRSPWNMVASAIATIHAHCLHSIPQPAPYFSRLWSCCEPCRSCELACSRGGLEVGREAFLN